MRWRRVRRLLGQDSEQGRGRPGALERLDGALELGRFSTDALVDVVERTRPGVRARGRLVRAVAAMVEAEQGPVEAGALTAAVRLARQGDYPARRLRREPALATWLSRSRWREEPMPIAAMAGDLRAYADAVGLNRRSLTGEEVGAVLRRFRHRQLLRIFLREIEGASLRQTTAEVADVAEVCLQMALEEAARLEGEDELAEEVCIFGMGKLGGRELNFSSDIDLIFVVADEAMDRVGPKVAEAVVRRSVGLMEEVSDDGHVFRVDLRLRPEGSRGRLIITGSALVEYYLNWGRSWERGVWLKARPVAGDRSLGEKILREVEPFLYRRHLDFDAIDELRRMKRLIDEETEAVRFVSAEAESSDMSLTSTSPFKARLLAKLGRSEARKRGPREGPGAGAGGQKGWDVKVGRGGIREIEFFVQALQLVHCGTRPGLRVRNTLEALDRLLYTGLVSATDHADLSDAYDLFRRLEHRIQMEDDRQFHRLPSDAAGLDDLAGRMGLEAEQLEGLVQRSREKVRVIFERLFSESARRPERPTVGEEEAGVLQRVIGLSAQRLLDEEVVQRLRAAGFERPRQVAGQLQVLRRKEYGPFSESPMSADPQVARYLLRAVHDAPDPEGALSYLVRFTTTVGKAPVMWSMLSENPHAARLLIHLFGSSPPLARVLAQEPDVFERLIYGGSARLDWSREEMEAELKQRLRSTRDRSLRMGRIRRFHREETLRIALHEVAGSVEVETTCRQLSDLAEVVLRVLFREVVDEFRRGDEGLSLGSDPVGELGLAVVAMGKLGGREMGFGSDLDFIFVYEADKASGLDHERATRIARRLVHALSATTAIGGLYDVDLRLRPSGMQGTLVVSVKAWRNYHEERAQLWERQALIRMRTLTGAGGLRERLEQGRQTLAFTRQMPDDAKEQVLTMRRRLEAQAGRLEPVFDVKTSWGGVLDVEFLTQWLQLISAGEAGVHEMRSTVEALRAMSEIGGAPVRGIDVEGLARDYLWLRRLQCRMEISGLGSVIPAEGAARRALVRQMGHQGRGGDRHFEAEMNAVRGRVHGAFRSVFDAT